MSEFRYDWSKSEIEAIYNEPLTELVFLAQSVHREYHNPDEIQWCSLLSIKTGACPEDCGYCAQSAHYDTGLSREPLMGVGEALDAARRARER
ncbi:MAG TPA: biotin synthase, partial [Blastocatellia bacterium]|nr:biotin synthase [Blastocatellia bacterium]